MLPIILVLSIAIAALVFSQFITSNNPAKQASAKAYRLGLRLLGVVTLLFAIVSTSFVFVGEDETGHRVKIYLGDNLKDGAIIADNSEKGPQAEIMPPGFHFETLLNVLNDISMQKIVDIPQNSYGFLVAKDGEPLRPDQTFADPFSPEEGARMVNDAAYFLNHGGQKGPQTSVLTPGRYRLNLFLWDVTTSQVTDVPKGFVGVLRSNVHAKVDFGNLKVAKPSICTPTLTREVGRGDLEVPLVPVGCIGVWDQPLNPGKYYINKNAYALNLVDTRIQTWEYRGGYRKRAIDLTLNQKGDLTQTERSENIARPPGAVSGALLTKIEGWDVPQELRVLVQITPTNAPYMVAAVGDLEKVEKRVLTPAIRSVLRNVVGGSIRVPTKVLDAEGKPVLDEKGHPVFTIITRPTLVLDLIENREVLESNVEEIIRPEGLKAGVEIKEVRFGDPVIPPEILLARRREQLAQQLKRAFAQERASQFERIAAEQAKATADQQQRLVEAQIEVKRSEQFALALRNEGRGERDKLNLIAEGQEAQARVLGKVRVVELRKFELLVNNIVDFFKEHPEVLTTALANAHKFVPERVFTIGDTNGANNLAGAAGILGDFLGGRNPAPQEGE